MARVILGGVRKVYGREVVALHDLSLEIDDGELLVLVGPSGCGKSTALRLIAGLEETTGGEIWIGGRRVTDLAPKDRDVAMVFQNAATFPYMSVADNLGFGLKLRRRPRPEVRARVDEVARALGLSDLLDRRPAQLSGGQRQRVAIGRAILRDPEVFLMDEPLSSLDARLRIHMRSDIARLQRLQGTTTLYVTHDQEEAMTLGDRVAVLKQGVLEQVSTPDDLYRHPASQFVGGFIGSPPMNLTQGVVSEHALSFAHVQVPLSDLGGRVVSAGRQVTVGIRPSDLKDVCSLAGAGEVPVIEGVVSTTENLGSEVRVVFDIDVPTSRPCHEAPSWEPGADRLFTACLDAGTRINAGDPIRVFFFPERLHIFDAETGRACRSQT